MTKKGSMQKVAIGCDAQANRRIPLAMKWRIWSTAASGL
jgi:hypothetical protein